MGVTVRQKRKGTGNPWYVFVHEKSRSVARKVGSKKEAEAVASKLRKELAARSFGIDDVPRNSGMLFMDYAQHYLDTYGKRHMKHSTRSGYQVALNKHLKPFWRGKRLNEITRRDIKAFLEAKQKETSPRGGPYKAQTLRNIMNLISGVLSHAIEDELIEVNPALRLGKLMPKNHRTNRDHQALTKDQVSAVLAATRKLYPDFHPLMLCAFRTGMRLGELLGLGWEDINFEERRIYVRRSYSHYRFGTPKTHKARRIDMSDQLVDTLRRHKQALWTKFDGQLPSVLVPEGTANGPTIELAFPSRTGKPIDGSWFRKTVRPKVFKAAGVPLIRLHDIRHTFASLLLQQGESLHYVKEQLGHASISTTVDIYGHLAQGGNHQAVNQLDDPANEPIFKIASSA